MSDEEKCARARGVARMIAFTNGTRLQAGPYERHLLAEYVRGRLTLRQVEQLLARHQPLPQ